MPTPEQFQAAQDRELEGIRAAIERALEANQDALSSLGRGRRSRRNKKPRRKGTHTRRRRSRRH